MYQFPYVSRGQFLFTLFTLCCYVGFHYLLMAPNEVDLANVLRAPDPNYKDAREPFRYPKTRELSAYRKLDRDVSDARKDELKDAWDEGVMDPKMALKAGIVHNAFDAKSLGIGGAHVVELRRPGLRNEDGLHHI